ncbi:MAG: hypothetical protein J1F66_01815 [Clostridiales bacterium]|nr:hypothetical protein [Clostridiales bacterium]
MRKSKFVYILGALVVFVLLLMCALTYSLVQAKGESPEKPRFDLPNDVPWDKIPWQDFPDDFPYDEVPWDQLPDDMPWEKVPWEDVPWEELPDNYPWEDIPWDDLPDDFDWGSVTCTHRFGDWETYIAATCMSPGVALRRCDKCKFVVMSTIPATGEHVYEDEWQRTADPTCGRSGWEYRTCVQCHLVRETRELKPTGEHVFDQSGRCSACDMQQLTVRSASASKEYDGAPLYDMGYDVLYGSLPEGHKIQVYSFATLETVGSIANTFMVKILDSDGNDITHGYQITLEYGTLTMTQRQLTITTGSLTAVYNGSALVCHEYTQIGLLQGDEIKIEFTAQLTERGTCANVATVRIMRNGVDVTANYSIAFVFGTLTLR